MKLLLLCPQWGHEHLPLEEFFSKAKEAGYDGIETSMPEDVSERKKFIQLLESYNLSKSLIYYLLVSMECDPLLINSHSGRDYFSLDEQLRVLDTVEEFSVKNKILVAHETHRGRIGYSPYNAMELFQLRPDMKITADFSHWTCVTESLLENSQSILAEAIRRTKHLHARVGFTEGPQIPDPRLAAWKEHVDFFMNIWKQIIEHQKSNADIFTITPEFGPPPYMWTRTDTNEPIASQWEINVYMMNLIKDKFGSYAI